MMSVRISRFESQTKHIKIDEHSRHIIPVAKIQNNLKGVSFFEYFLFNYKVFNKLYRINITNQI